MREPVARKLLFLVLLCHSAIYLSGQVYVADTLIIPFGTDTIEYKTPYHFNVVDYRNEPPKLISTYEKKKWLFFPVDQIVNLEKPLNKSFETKFNNSQSNQIYQLRIHNFNYEKTESTFKRTFTLNASIELYDLSQISDSTPVGVFYYELTSSQKNKDSIRPGFIAAIDTFSNSFAHDINAVCNGKDTAGSINTYHFRRGYSSVKKNFYTTTDIYYGINFWGIDGELWFSTPEPEKKFKRNAGMIRYLNYGNRQTVGFAKNVRLLNYRISDKWLFQNKYAFLLGLNKWNDVDAAKRTFEEIFTFQLTATQRICYNPLDQKGFVWGVGIMEEASYIIYNKPLFNVALVGHLAIKF